MSEPVVGRPTRTVGILPRKGVYRICRLYTDSETLHSAIRRIPDRRDNDLHKQQMYNQFKHLLEHIGGYVNSFEIFERAISNNPDMPISFLYVDGHSGNQHNMAVQILAKEGAEKYSIGNH